MTIISTGAYDFPAAADRNRNSLLLQTQYGPWDTQGQPAGPLSVVDGVHSGMNLTKTTGMGFQIEPGRAAVNGASAADGTFTCAITSPEISTFEPGHETWDRTDVVILRTYPDNPSTSGVKVEVVTGVPTGPLAPGFAPPVPAVPAGSLKLYQVVIPAGTSASNGGWNTAKLVDLRSAIGVPKFIDYTPTWGGLDNKGSGYVSRGRYRVDGDKVSVHTNLRGGVGAIMNSPSLLNFTLPIPAIPGWIYNGSGSLHHPNITGLAFDLRIISNGGNAIILAIDPASNALAHPGQRQIPFGQGTEIFCSLEYYIVA